MANENAIEMCWQTNDNGPKFDNDIIITALVYQ